MKIFTLLLRSDRPSKVPSLVVTLNLNVTNFSIFSFATGSSSALIHYGFENYKLNEIYDDSGNNINAALVSGAFVTKVQSRCGAAVNMDGGEIVIEGTAIRGMYTAL